MSGGVTTNYGLAKPNFNQKPWDGQVNGNWDLIDTLLYTITQIPNIGGVWQNSTQYLAGKNVLDPNTLTFYNCLVTHVSAASGSFAADRIANPANWTVTTASGGYVRYDQGQVLTSGQQAQARTNIGAIDLTALGNSAVRYDTAQSLTYNQILQVLNTLLIDGTESSIVASSSTDIGNAGSQNVVITGNATIVSFGNRPNKYKLLRFATTLTLTNSSSLVLPGAANILTQAGDTALATSDASGNWYVRAYQRADGTALVAPNTSNLLRFDAAQTLTNAQAVQALSNLLLLTSQLTLTQSQQDFLRLNSIGVVVPLSVSANATLAAADIERTVLITGSPTITLPNIGAGWRTGPLRNANTITGTATIAVPSGATLDGVTNGSLLLFPFQRARVVQVDATTYITDWIDRTPVVASVNVASAVASFDANIPVGYSRIRYGISGVSLSTPGSDFAFRLSDSGVGGLKSGASDYYNDRIYYYGSTSGTAAANQSYGLLAIGIFDNSGLSRTMVNGWLYPGATGQQPQAHHKTYRRNNDPSFVAEEVLVVYQGTTSGAVGRANLIRILASAGNINPGAVATFYGEP